MSIKELIGGTGGHLSLFRSVVIEGQMELCTSKIPISAERWMSVIGTMKDRSGTDMNQVRVCRDEDVRHNSHMLM
jgi:hypothetical protein